MRVSEDSPAPRLRSLSLGSEFSRRLEALTVRTRRLIMRGGVASRAGSVRGGRVEFLDHRGYVEGDDLRDLDWNVYARTDEPFVKIFGAEREKQVNILLDLSPSMAAAKEKELYACRLAVAIAHIALAAGDTVAVSVIASTARPALRQGVSAARDIGEFLERVPLTPPIEWVDFFTVWSKHQQRAGVTIIISDFWAKDIAAALTPLAGARQEVNLLRVLTPAERTPPLFANVHLEDAETGEEVSLCLSKHDLAVYRAAAEKHLRDLAENVSRLGMRHLLCMTDIPFEHLVLHYLQQGGLLR